MRGGEVVYSIGKLAELSRVSLRTLRYYDEIGLLPPAERNAKGHRFYSNEDVSKLHYILTLRNVGLPLESIQTAMNDKQLNSKILLEMRLKMIQTEQQKLMKMENSIKSLLALVENGQDMNWESIFESFYTYPKSEDILKKLWDKHFSTEEQSLLKKLPSMGEGSKLAKEATALVKDVRVNVKECPTSQIGQQLAKRWITLVQEMYKGNVELANKVWNLNKENEVTGFFQFEDDLVIFIDQAIQHYYESNGGGMDV